MEAVLAVIATREPFIRHAEDARGHRGLPRRRHFRFFYRSALGRREESDVLLDVVDEAREVHTVVGLPVRAHFLPAEREVLVRVPTIESLLGDKLTAFAPHTSGVPLYRPDGTVRDVQQVAKQLFDIGVLFDAATDFSTIADSYDAMVEIERSYRFPNPSREDCLRDTWNACIGLVAATMKKAVAGRYPDGVHLHDGLDRMRGHITDPTYAQMGARPTLAAKCALLAAHLWTHEHFDFGHGRWANTPDQLEGVRTASLNGTHLPWLDRMKGVNPEAYFYLHEAVMLLRGAGLV